MVVSDDVDDGDGDDASYDVDLLVAKCKPVGSPLYFPSEASNGAPDIVGSPDLSNIVGSLIE